MKVLILDSNDYWQGIYIDGNLIDEGHSLGGGQPQIYLLKKSEEYGFSSSDVSFKWLSDKDDQYLSEQGGLPKKLEELSGDY